RRIDHRALEVVEPVNRRAGAATNDDSRNAAADLSVRVKTGILPQTFIGVTAGTCSRWADAPLRTQSPAGRVVVEGLTEQDLRRRDRDERRDERHGKDRMLEHRGHLLPGENAATECPGTAQAW